MQLLEIHHFEANAQRDAVVECHGNLRAIAVTLFAVANNIRWLGSGPRAGYYEIRLGDLQPGSSIMPGKVNPVMCESLMQVAARVIGNDQTIAFCGAAAGATTRGTAGVLIAAAGALAAAAAVSASALFSSRKFIGSSFDFTHEQTKLRKRNELRR